MPSGYGAKGKVTLLGRMTYASSSSERPAVNPAGPLPVVLKAKSWASLGTASLMIVIDEPLVLVKVQVTFSPASSPIVATLPAVLVLAPPPTQTRLVSAQPATAPSV